MKFGRSWDLPRGRSSSLRWIGALFVGVFVAWCLCSTSTVRADAKDEARIMFEAGVAASRAERWLEASEYFHRSLSLAEKPSTWFNLAVAEIKQGHGRAGLAALDAFERSANPKDHAEMLQRVPALRMQAEGLPEPDPAPDSETPQVQPESDAREPLDRDPVPVTAKAGMSEPQKPEPPADLGPPRKMIGMGVVGALGAVGAFGYLVNRSKKLDKCEADLDRCTNQSVIQSETRLGLGLGISLAVVSVGLVAAGTTWLVHAKGRNARSLSVSDIQVGPRGAAFKLSFRF